MFAKMHATSSYTMELIENRLAVLRERGEQSDVADEAERQREISYLVELRARKSAEAEANSDSGK